MKYDSLGAGLLTGALVPQEQEDLEDRWAAPAVEDEPAVAQDATLYMDDETTFRLLLEGVGNETTMIESAPSAPSATVGGNAGGAGGPPRKRSFADLNEDSDNFDSLGDTYPNILPETSPVREESLPAPAPPPIGYRQHGDLSYTLLGPTSSEDEGEGATSEEEESSLGEDEGEEFSLREDSEEESSGEGSDSRVEVSP